MQNYMLFLLLMLSFQLVAQDPSANYPIYNGNDLGLTYTAQASTFKIWSPTASAVRIHFYKADLGGDSYRTATLQKNLNGIWQTTITENIKDQYYTFQVNINGIWSAETLDPYAKACGTNGMRAQVVDLKDTNPVDWAKDQSPRFSDKNLQTDAIIYELHVRDASIHPNSGIKNKGKFLGLAETGTKNAAGLFTGLSHMKELGVTHIHLLPFYDYNSVDETKSNQYNWGYDPVNYNIPEGSYSTNPSDGKQRIKELKKTIQTIHKNGLRVVMDVVYNHTALTEQSNFNVFVPDYYYRKRPDGTFSDASACGNETASEKAMFRKFMLESVLYWVKEYHVDGFRFDLMGIHDIETMNLIADTLRKIKPSIVLYGEGWTAGGSPLPDSLKALKQHARRLKGVAVFSDDMRDGIKGSVFNIDDRGFATGKIVNAESVKFGVVAAGQHPQINYGKVNYSKGAYTSGPAGLINYADCHDNNILWDKIALSYKDASEEQRIKMHELAYAIVLTAQGTPFLTAGSEFLRTKYSVENSFNSGDSINAINWNLKTKNIATYQYIQSLVLLRKAHPAFRMTTAQHIAENLVFQDHLPEGLIGYTINGAAVGDTWKKIWVGYNGNLSAKTIELPAGNWKIASIRNASALKGNLLTLDGSNAVILFQ
jgi:pullulanase